MTSNWLLSSTEVMRMSESGLLEMDPAEELDLLALAAPPKRLDRREPVPPVALAPALAMVAAASPGATEPEVSERPEEPPPELPRKMEFAVLGLMAGVLAGAGATGIGWALGHFVFKLPYAPNLLPLGVGAVAGVLVVTLAGWLGTRRLLS